MGSTCSSLTDSTNPPKPRNHTATLTCTSISLIMDALSSPPAAAPRAAPRASNSSMNSTAGAKLRSICLGVGVECACVGG
jgi:hypothetical protein